MLQLHTTYREVFIGRFFIKESLEINLVSIEIGPLSIRFHRAPRNDTFLRHVHRHASHACDRARVIISQVWFFFLSTNFVFFFLIGYLVQWKEIYVGRVKVEYGRPYCSSFSSLSLSQIVFLTPLFHKVHVVPLVLQFLDRCGSILSFVIDYFHHKLKLIIIYIKR